MENQGFITQDDFMTMLMNYPIEHINNITDGLAKDVDGMKALAGESMAKLNASIRDEASEEMDDSKFHRARHRKLSLNDHVTEVRKGDFAAVTQSRVQPKMSDSQKHVNVSVQSGAEKDLRGSFEGRSRRGSKHNTSIPEQYEMMSTVLRRKGSADSSINYQIQCTTINNRIKQYVAGLFMEYECRDEGKMTLEKFQEWITQHPMVLSHFEDNFHLKIWKANNQVDDRLNFKTLKTELNFWASFYTNPKKKERLWIEMHDKFLICLISKDDNVPRRVVLLDGLTLTLPEASKGVYRFVLSHKSPYYKVVHLDIEDKDAFDSLVKRLSYLRE